MADAYGKLTGQQGVCIVSRGPGATHASIACHTAFQDGTPMILIIGDVATYEREREAFQEIAFDVMFRPLSKRVIRVDEARRIPEFIDLAFRTATAGRPGPVVVTIAEDLLAVEIDCEPPLVAAPRLQTYDAVDPGALAILHRELSTAERPLIVAGGGGWTQASSTLLAELAVSRGVPVATTFRCQDVIDNESEAYVGPLGFGTNPELWEYAANADVVINIGARFDGPSTRNFSLFDRAHKNALLVHMYPTPELFSGWPSARIGVIASVEQSVRALAAVNGTAAKPSRRWLAELRHNLIQWRKPGPTSGPVDLGEIVCALSDRLAPDSIITTGAGNYTGWVHRYYRFRRVGTYLGPRNGAMGYGIPAAIAARIIRKESHVIAFGGDGCFMMASHELCTIKHYNLKVIMLVINNNMYGTVRMHQLAEFPGQTFATGLSNPDFVQLGDAYGFDTYRVRSTREFYPAIESALASANSALIEILTENGPISA
jgi:acetolactate synthase-1/2/3 large subunit